MEHLDDEERIAVGKPRDLIEQAVLRRSPQTIGHQVAHFGIAETCQRQPAAETHHGGEHCGGIGVARQLGLARGAQHEEWHRSELASDEFEQPQRTDVRPVQVVENDQQRLGAGGRRERRDDPIEELEARAIGRARERPTSAASPRAAPAHSAAIPRL